MGRPGGAIGIMFEIRATCFQVSPELEVRLNNDLVALFSTVSNIPHGISKCL
jgi:hypothetical protein